VTLPRSTATRLLEACYREAVACLAQPELGIASDYKLANGDWKVFPFALLEGEIAQAYQINIVVMPFEYNQGVGAVNTTMLDVTFYFHFPVNIRTFQVGIGANSYLDHVCALRDWLFRGGTWADRAGVDLPSAPIEDPDSANRELAHLVHFGWDVPFMMPNKAALVVPAGALWETRETARGGVV
jgi:hypothetical protein